MTLICWATAFLLLYAVIADRLFAFGSRFRKQAMGLALRLLDDASLPEATKAEVMVTLVRIPQGQTAWLYAAGVIPAVAKVAAQRIATVTSRARAILSHDPINASNSPAWDEFTEAALLGALCSSPLAAFLFAVQMLLVSLLLSGRTITSLEYPYVLRTKITTVFPAL